MPPNFDMLWRVLAIGIGAIIGTVVMLGMMLLNLHPAVDIAAWYWIPPVVGVICGLFFPKKWL